MPNLAETIQLAIAPVFLLTAVAGMISALTQRLARAIDRLRVLQKMLSDTIALPSSHQSYLYLREMRYIRYRIDCISVSMVLLVICSIMIGVTILELFYLENTVGIPRFSAYLLYTFVGGVGSFILALIVFLAEVLLAAYSIRNIMYR